MHSLFRWTVAVATMLFCLAPPVRAQVATGVYEGVPWPIVAPPVAFLPPSPHFAEPFQGASTPAARRLVELVQQLQSSIRVTRYEHRTVIRERDGVYLWDCSGMMTWMLRRTAPGAMRAITRGRPVARDFVAAIERAPAQPRASWQRIGHIADVRPGDIFAWRRPRGFPSRNTGHVGVVVHRPVPVAGMPGAYAVRVADSTSWGHQDDSRPSDGVGGFGTGTLTFLTDGQGHGTHYGWGGTLSSGYVTTPILFGRVAR